MRADRIAVALGAAAIALLFLFPPFFGVDTTAPASRHASLGHRAAWDAPTAEHVRDALVARGVAPPGVDAATFEARVSRVRLTMEAFGVAAATAVAVLALRARGRGRMSRGTSPAGPRG